MNRPRTSWQTLLTDLSLVLFMVTAGALGRARLERHSAVAAPMPPPPSAPSPLAVYRDGPGAPPLGTWLAQQPRDARQQLTIVARYAPGTERQVPRQVAALLAAANGAGVHPRIVVEPGEGGISAGVGFDALPVTPPPPAPSVPLAHDLQPAAQDQPHRTPS